jgi:hypothetical protein
MDKLKYYTAMEARYRKQADTELEMRERHLANARGWRLLADMRTLVSAQQSEISENLAALQPRGRQGE